MTLHSGEDSDVDSEVEDRVDGVKSWLSKNKGSTKTLSDDGKTPRSVYITVFLKSWGQAPCLEVKFRYLYFQQRFSVVWIVDGFYGQ